MPSERKYVRVPDSGDTFPQSVPLIGDTLSDEKAKRAARKFARIPADLILDPQLKDRDVRIYSAFSLLERNGVVNCGVRWIGQCCTFSRSEVSRSVARLVARGHIEVQELGRGKRKAYRLTSVVFKKPEKESSEESPRVQASAARIELQKCANCKKPCKSSSLTGWCRKCMADSHTRAIVREEVARIG